MSMGDDFIDVFYGEGQFTNFGAMLFRLIAKADLPNLNRLRKSYPTETTLYDWWMMCEAPPPIEDVRKKADEIDAEQRMWP